MVDRSGEVVVPIPLDDWSGASATKALHADVLRMSAEGKRRERIILAVSVLSLLAGIASVVVAIVKG